MTKKFAIVLALFVISIVCCAGCIGPGDNEDPEIPDVPDVPDVPDTPVDPVDPVVPVEEYSVMFMLNYGDAGAYTAETVKAGETVSKPANPTRSGYTFKGWFTAAEGGAEYDFTQAVNADVTLYAQWKKKSSGSSHTHVYKTGGQKGSQYGLFCSCGAFKSTGTVDNAIEEAPAGATITLVDSTPATEPIVISKEDNVIIDGAGKEATLQYEDVESIQIKAEGSDHLTVVIPYTKEDNSEGTKTVYLEEVEGKDLLVPAAAVDDENNVGDAYTASGLLAIANMINGDGASGVSLQTDDHVQVLSSAPVGDSVSDSLVLCYEPATTTLGDEPEAEKPWTITLQDNINLKDVEWTPIGTKDKPFTGTFDGQGHTIYDLTVTGTGEDYVGFFGYVCGTPTGLPTDINSVYTAEARFSADTTKYSTVIKNLNLVNVNVKGAVENTGALAGQVAYTYVHNVKVGSDGEKVDARGSISGGKAVGGVVGKGVGSYIDSCVNYVPVSTDSSLTNRYHLGGIAGSLRATEDEFKEINPHILSIVSNSKNYATVIADLTAGGAGGICGQTSGAPGLVIYNSVNGGTITVSASAAPETNYGTRLASGILGTDGTGTTPIVIASCTSLGEITTTGENQLTSLNGIFGYSSNAKIIDCTVKAAISGSARHVAGIIADIPTQGGEGVTISNSKVTSELENKYVAYAPGSSKNVGTEEDPVYEPVIYLIYDGMTFNNVEDFAAALPSAKAQIKFGSKTTFGNSVPATLKSEVVTLDFSDVTPSVFSINVPSDFAGTACKIILPNGADVTITGSTGNGATLTLKGEDIKVTNNAEMANVGLEIDNAISITNPSDKSVKSITVKNSDNVEILNGGIIAKRVMFYSSDNAVLTNRGTIGSIDKTTSNNQHVIQIMSGSDKLVIHNHGIIKSQVAETDVTQGYLIHNAGDGIGFLNYEEAVVQYVSQTNYLFAGFEKPQTNAAMAFAFADSIKDMNEVSYSFTHDYVYNATKIHKLDVEYTGTGAFNKENVKVYANFTTDNGYKTVELDNNWLVFTENADNVKVSFLGKFETPITLTAEGEEGENSSE